ncbi:MAG: ATP-binding cassette domain-containing protein [Lachnospiraceae bacterium]|nr:ATP-binding cassette domain-containing protein [Lachnospiraceae bacterium]
MHWFDDQLRKRRLGDDELFQRSLQEAARTVMGSRGHYTAVKDIDMAESAIGEILRYYGLSYREIPDSIERLEDQLDYALRPYGIMYRKVELKGSWQKDALGAYLGFYAESGKPVAFIPSLPSGYTCHDPEAGNTFHIAQADLGKFAQEAYCFYRPFPQKSLSIKDLLRYILSCLQLSDYLLTFGISLLTTMVGLLVPQLTYILFNDVIQTGEVSVLMALAVFLLSISISELLIGASSELISNRMDMRLSMNVESATMMRILSLPAGFFRKYNAGELSSRAESVNTLCSSIVNVFFSTGLSSLMSLLYVTQIFRFAPVLVVPSLCIILAGILVSLCTVFLETRRQKELLLENSKCLGLAFALVNGVQKIRLAGAEKRAYAHWAFQYNKSAALQFNPPLLLKLSGVISTSIELAGTVVLYSLAISSGITPAGYLAFSSAYGSVAAAFGSLFSIVTVLAKIKPILQMAAPILETAPETDENREIITSLKGPIELQHVKFRYDENSPYIVNDLSLKIHSGEYIAIVGRTGCGKSTLVRLLLGFETPEQGAIFYAGRNLNKIDVKSLRRQIGTVMQDSGLFQGDIYSNITLSAPHLSMKEAWEAAEIACIADDIREMPMGMNTFLSEGQGGISGGQKQRLMIARAVAPKPSVLIFDEATSALDNISQKKVTEALDKLHCTRIVIAHRLSTIRHCDRIVYLGDGKIQEEGTYEELMKKDGLFAELVKRQLT